MAPIPLAASAPGPKVSFELTPDGNILKKVTAASGTLTERIARLPEGSWQEGAEVALVVDFDGDGFQDVILERAVKDENAGFGESSHIDVFRGGPGDVAARAGNFDMEGPAGWEVIAEPDAHKPVKVIKYQRGGAYWGSAYLLSRDGRSLEEAYSGSGWARLDLDGDGTAEVVTYDWHLNDRRCYYDRLAGNDFEILRFDEATFAYKRSWPETPGSNVAARLQDMDEDGIPEVVALVDSYASLTRGRSLVISKLTPRGWKTLAQLDVTVPGVAIDLLAVRRLHDGAQALVGLREAPCLRQVGLEEQPGHRWLAGYSYRQGRLSHSWTADAVDPTESFEICRDEGSPSTDEVVYLDFGTQGLYRLSGESELSQIAPLPR